MSGRRKWSETRDSRLKGDADRTRYAVGRERFRARLNAQLQTLAELRRARKLTQEQLAAAMHVSQAQVSRVENQADLYLSTLRSYIEALGGELQIRVAFPGGKWTEVAIGDITEAEYSSSTVVGIATGGLTATTGISVLAASMGGLILSSTTFLSQSLRETPGLSALPSVLGLRGASQSVLSANIATLWSDSAGVERFAGVREPDFSSPLNIIYFSGHGVANPTRHIEMHTKVDWVQSTELRVPKDADDFVTSATFKEG